MHKQEKPKESVEDRLLRLLKLHRHERITLKKQAYMFPFVQMVE